MIDNSDLRKWHVAIGLIVITGIFAFVYSIIEPVANPRTMSPMIFQGEVFSPPIGNSHPQPRIQDVRVYPSEDGLYVVNFNRIVPDPSPGQDRYLLQAWSFTEKHPTFGSSERIPDWLQRMHENPQAHFNYTYEWWREPKKLLLMWGALASVLAVWGILIPGVSWVAKGGVKEFRENATASRELSEEADAPRKEVSAEEHARLTDMIGRLEGVHGTQSGSHSAAGAPAAGAAAGPVRALDGKALEVQETHADTDKPRDFKGEFYPVARAGQAAEAHKDKPEDKEK